MTWRPYPGRYQHKGRNSVMRYSHFLLALKTAALACVMSLITSCGEETSDDEGAICQGVTTNGVCLYVDILVHDYNGANSNEVDVSENICVVGDPLAVPPVPDVFEGFYNHDVSVTFTADPYGQTGTSATLLRVTGYQVTYTANVGTAGVDVPLVPATPLLAPANPITMNVGGTATSNFVLFDINQKNAFAAEDGVTWNSALYPTPSYTVAFTFFAKDEFDNEIQTVVTTQALIGHWDYCDVFGLR